MSSKREEVSLYWSKGSGPSSAAQRNFPGAPYLLDESQSFTLYAVPEPQTYALLSGLGLFGFAVWRRLSR